MKLSDCPRRLVQGVISRDEKEPRQNSTGAPAKSLTRSQRLKAYYASPEGKAAARARVMKMWGDPATAAKLRAHLQAMKEDPAWRAAAIHQPADGPDSESRAAVVFAATDHNGQFWPRRAVDHIATLRSHAERAAAFNSIPPAFRVMVQKMLHRCYYNLSRV